MMKTSTISLGPILSRLLRLHEMYTEVCEINDAAMFPQDSSAMDAWLERESREVVGSFGLSVPLFNDMVRARVGGRWLDDNHHWALVLDEES